LAAIYQDLLHRIPPYPITSAPVVFGTVGGLAMIAGVCGLVAIKLKSDPAPSLLTMMNSDYMFLIILGLTSLSGISVLLLRNTSAMGSLLIVHLGIVAALFITAPYGKFVHSMYRSLALILHRAEQARARVRSEDA
jgi:citrate/tricarballylate utilization protein